MKTMIGSFKEDNAVDTYFTISALERKIAWTGIQYLQFRLTDRSGSIAGFLWHDLHREEELDNAIYVRVKGTVKTMGKANVLLVEDIRPAERSEVDIREIFGSGEHIDEKLMSEILKLFVGESPLMIFWDGGKSIWGEYP